MSYYDGYYSEQVGGGGRGVHNVFVGSRGQRGHGIGSFLAGLFRRALPLITKGARAVGKEAVRAGMNILEDVTENNMGFKDSLNRRMTESGIKLKRKATEKIHNFMQGSGYRGRAVKRKRQSSRGTRSSNTVRRKKGSRVKKVKRKRLTGGKKNKKKTKPAKKRASRKKRVKVNDIFD